MAVWDGGDHPNTEDCLVVFHEILYHLLVVEFGVYKLFVYYQAVIPTICIFILLSIWWFSWSLLSWCLSSIYLLLCGSIWIYVILHVPSIYYLSTYLPIHLSNYLYVWSCSILIYLSRLIYSFLFLFLSSYLSLCLFRYFYLSLSISTYLYLFLSISMFIFASVCLPVWLTDWLVDWKLAYPTGFLHLRHLSTSAHIYLHLFPWGVGCGCIVIPCRMIWDVSPLRIQWDPTQTAWVGGFGFYLFIPLQRVMKPTQTLNDSDIWC